MRVLTKEQPLDDGTVIYEQDLIVARLQQDPPRDVEGTVFDFVAEGVAEQAQHIKAFHQISKLVESDPSDKNLSKMAELQEILDTQNLWLLDSRIADVIAHLELPADEKLSALSGGWLRKAALGRALVSGPKVLFLDEPTNHLDIETIQWLESFLKNFSGSIVFISHDRSFIRNMATRIIDLDRGKLASWRAVMMIIWWPRKRHCVSKRCRMRNLTASWRRKKSGSVRASKPAVPVMKGASVP